VSAFSVRQAGRIATAQLLFIAFAGGCAEGTQQSSLNSDTLVEGSTAGSTAAGGSSAGADATGGMPTAGDTAMPMAGTTSAGTTSAAGTGGSPVETGGSGGAAGAAGSGGAGGSLGGAGGAGGKAAGGMAGSGMAGSGGAAPTGFRYAKLVATSEQTGAVWSSVAELQIMTTGGAAINRAGWVIVADSQELDDEVAPATAAIDGDTATFWHTSWKPAPNDVADPKLPHYLIVDLVTSQAITGFSYLPRQTGTHGHVKGWEFYVSKDGVNWGAALKTGTFPDVTTLQTITF
jgi:F5/8 type C domain